MTYVVEHEPSRDSQRGGLGITGNGTRGPATGGRMKIPTYGGNPRSQGWWLGGCVRWCGNSLKFAKTQQPDDAQYQPNHNHAREGTNSKGQKPKNNKNAQMAKNHHIYPALTL